jgi:hypothetical protein
MSDKESQDKDQGLWIVLARVEDESSVFPEERRITKNLMVQMANAYDPEFRKAPVLAAGDGRGAHDQEAHKHRKAVAFIEELDTDGLNLYGRISSDDEIAFAGKVAEGFRQRSVEFVRKLPELEDAPPYLLRLAMLSGEQPGQPNLPDLSNYVDTRSLEGLTIENRSFLDPIEEQPEEKSMQTDEILAKLKELISPLEDKLSEQGERLDTLSTSVRDGEEAIKTASERAEKALEEAKGITSAGREERIGTLLATLVREERLAPFEVEAEKKVLSSLSGEDYDERVEFLKSKPQRFQGKVGEELVLPSQDKPITVPREFRMPDGTMPDARDMETYLELAEGCETDEDFHQRVLDLAN